jgi:hypothetical protein
MCLVEIVQSYGKHGASAGQKLLAALSVGFAPTFTAVFVEQPSGSADAVIVPAVRYESRAQACRLARLLATKNTTVVVIYADGTAKRCKQALCGIPTIHASTKRRDSINSTVARVEGCLLERLTGQA